MRTEHGSDTRGSQTRKPKLDVLLYQIQSDLSESERHPQTARPRRPARDRGGAVIAGLAKPAPAAQRVNKPFQTPGQQHHAAQPDHSTRYRQRHKNRTHGQHVEVDRTGHRAEEPGRPPHPEILERVAQPGAQKRQKNEDRRANAPGTA